MRMSHRRALGWAVLVLLAAVPAAARAQDTACSYDACALRIHYSFLTARVIQGASGASVAKLGGFSPRVDALARSPDPRITIPYGQFRASSRRAAALSLIGFAATVGAALSYHSYRTTAYVLLGSSVVASLVQMEESRRSWDRLETAIWWYNRGLPGASNRR